MNCKRYYASFSVLIINFIYLVNKLKKNTAPTIIKSYSIIKFSVMPVPFYSVLQVLPALYFITLNHTGDTITISVFRKLCTFPLIQRPISRTFLPSVLARPTVRENLMNVTRSYRSAAEVWQRSQPGTGREIGTAHRASRASPVLYKTNLTFTNFRFSHRKAIVVSLVPLRFHHRIRIIYRVVIQLELYKSLLQLSSKLCSSSQFSIVHLNSVK